MYLKTRSSVFYFLERFTLFLESQKSKMTYFSPLDFKLWCMYYLFIKNLKQKGNPEKLKYVMTLEFISL